MGIFEDLVHRWEPRINISLTRRKFRCFCTDVPPSWCCCDLLDAHLVRHNSCIVVAKMSSLPNFYSFQIILGENACLSSSYLYWSILGIMMSILDYCFDLSFILGLGCLLVSLPFTILGLLWIWLKGRLLYWGCYEFG